MPTATYSKKINKAFVLSPNDLRYFYGEGKHFMEKNAGNQFKTEIIGAVKNIDAILVREEPESIIEYSNPRLNEIQSIAILMKSEDEEYFFKLVFQNTAFDSPVHLNIGGKNPPEVEPCSRKLEAELMERSQWYSFISNRVWLIKYRWVFLTICALIVIWSLISVFIRTQRLNRARTEVSAILSKYEDSAADPNQAQIREKAKGVLEVIDKARSPVIFVKWVLFGIVSFFIANFSERLIYYLFPRVVFEIGAGRKRHENIKKARKIIGYWLMSLIIGLVLLMIGRRLQVGLSTSTK